MLSFYKAITDFGDPAVTGPLALAVFLLALSQRNSSLALSWAIATVTAALGVTVLKIIGYSCSAHLLGAGLVSPSGHTAISTAVYGCLTILAMERWRKWRWAAACAGFGVILAIGISRVYVQAHTRDEVLLGWAWGALSCWLFARLWKTRSEIHLPVRWAAIFVTILLTLYGQSISAEDRIHELSGWLRAETGICR